MSEDQTPYQTNFIQLESHDGPIQVKLKNVDGKWIPEGTFLDAEGPPVNLYKRLMEDTYRVLQLIIQVTRGLYKASTAIELSLGRQSADALTLEDLPNRFDLALESEFDEYNFSSELFLHASREHNKEMQFWTLFVQLSCWREHWLHIPTDEMHEVWLFSINKNECYLDVGFSKEEKYRIAKDMYREFEEDYYLHYQKIEK